MTTSVGSDIIKPTDVVNYKLFSKGASDMTEQFEHIDLTNEKVQRIINYGFKEFSEQPFEKASTNEIVKNAQVSRGLLYHYFKDKENLYDFLICYSIKLTIEELENKINWNETDFFNRLRDSILLKLQLMDKYPYLLEFYNRIDKQTVLRYKQQEIDEILSFKKKFYHYNLEFNNLKPDVDIEKMMNLTKFAVKQITQNHTDTLVNKEKHLDKEALLKEIDTYLEFIRSTFYK